MVISATKCDFHLHMHCAYDVVRCKKKVFQNANSHTLLEHLVELNTFKKALKMKFGRLFL
jgi:hypothetical protein